MKTLTNQTIYQCEECDKRFLTKRGASMHEKNHCPVIRERLTKEYQTVCKHSSTYIVYRRMPGESHLMEPSHEECHDCGAEL